MSNMKSSLVEQSIDLIYAKAHASSKGEVFLISR